MSTLFSHFFQKINQISPLEADFTEVLNSIALTPKMLYFYGKMPENVAKNTKNSASGGLAPTREKAVSGASEPVASSAPACSKIASPASSRRKFSRPKTVAIVGSRHNTRYGEEIAYDLAFKLAKKGVIIVSGLAFGIDSIAHRGCLAADGTTLAVLGTPINDIYPREHFRLAEEIVEKGGAIISEYAPRTAEYKMAPLGFGEAGLLNGRWVSPSTATSLDNSRQLLPGIEKEFTEINPPFSRRRLDPKNSFLYRNRIISGLSDIVVVVEAAERSGSLNTAMHALEQGKSVYAVPGNITSPMSQGCNKLIQQGATPLTSPDDILRELFPEDFKKPRKNSKATLTGDSPAETAILNALSNGLRAGEDIIKSANLSPELFNQTATLLEIKGRVRSLGLNQWCLS